jgi:hypothetical protein
MAGYTGPLLAVAAIGALGAVTPSRDEHRNVYAGLDDCQRDNPSGCTLERENNATRAFGPWASGNGIAAATAGTLAIATETRRGGFGGWACGPGGSDDDSDDDKKRGGGGG